MLVKPFAYPNAFGNGRGLHRVREVQIRRQMKRNPAKHTSETDSEKLQLVRDAIDDLTLGKLSEGACIIAISMIVTPPRMLTQKEIEYAKILEPEAAAILARQKP